jgi:hypothetical protein
MAFSLKRAVNNAFGIGGQEMDRIAELPMTQLRLELKNAWQDKKFTQEMYDDFVARLAKVDDLKGQKDIAKGAVEKGEVENELDIELNTPAKQLLWAATLTRLMDASTDSPVAQKRLWKQLQDTMGVYNESIRIGNMLMLSMQNEDVTYSWGQPGSWFYQDPTKNHLNFDLYFMLLCGFEHVRSVEGHEIGHSQLSTGYPPKMQELYEKVKKYIDPRTVEKDGAEPPKMGKKDQVELAGEVAEWQYRHRAWNCLEDLTVDQFAIDLERFIKEQNFGDSLNHAAMVLRGYGEILRGDDLKKPVKVTTDLPAPRNQQEKDILDKIKEQIEKEAEEQQKKQEEFQKRMTTPLTPDDIKDIKAGKISPELAQKMYEETTRAALLAGYVKNGLFTDKETNWERFRVFADDIRQTIDMTKVPDANGRDAFQYLFDLCVEGDNSIRLLQPKPADRMLERNGKSVKESYKEVVAETTKARGEIMDKIWDIYLKPYADVMIQEYKNQTKKNLDQKQNGQGNQKGNQQGQGQGQSQSQQGQGQGQPGGSSSGSGGQPSQDQSGGGGEDNDPQDMDDDLKKQVGDMAENPHEKESKDQDKNGKGGQDKNDPNAEKKDGAGQDGEPKEQQPGKDKDGKGGPGWGQDQSQQAPPMKVGDMKDKKIQKEELSDEEKQAMKDAAKSMPKVDPNAMTSKGGNQRGVDLASLAKGDYKDFHRRTLELAPVINQRRAAWRNIKEQQRRQILQRSKRRDYLPPDGDIRDRLDMGQVLETKFKMATRQKLTTDDVKKFEDDDIFTTESAIKSIGMIDGSGSMPSINLGTNSLGQRVSAMDVALQAAVIDYVAARREGIPAWIVMWGDTVPTVIADPDMSWKQVGENIETYRNGTGSGTSLRPGLEKMVETAADYQTPPETISGSLHIQVYSDGDIQDKSQTIDALGTIAREGKNMSVDVAVLKQKSSPHTEMEAAFEAVVKNGGGRNIGVTRGSDPQEVALDLGEQQLRRVRSFNVKPEPDKEQRRRLKQLHRKLTGS